MAATVTHSHSWSASSRKWSRKSAPVYAYNRSGHRWERDYLGDTVAVITDFATLGIIVGLALRLGL